MPWLSHLPLLRWEYRNNDGSGAWLKAGTALVRWRNCPCRNGLDGAFRDDRCMRDSAIAPPCATMTRTLGSSFSIREISGDQRTRAKTAPVRAVAMLSEGARFWLRRCSHNSPTLFPASFQKTRHQNIPLRDTHKNIACVASFRTHRTVPTRADAPAVCVLQLPSNAHTTTRSAQNASKPSTIRGRNI